MGGVEFTIEGDGFDGLARELAEVEAHLLNQLDDHVADAASVAVDEAQSDVRVDSGDLQASIESNRLSWGHQIVTAGDGLGYASRIEALDPFFNPSIEQARDHLRLRIISTGLPR